MSSGKKSDTLRGLRLLKEVLPPNSPSPPRTIYGLSFFHRTGIKDSENLQKLSHFVDCINDGILPDGDVMIWMAEAIHEYLEGKKQTIDSAFSLKAKPKKGNAAKHYNEDVQLFEKILTMFLFMEDKKLNQQEAALKTLEFFNEDADGVDAFLKKYQRYISDKKHFKQMVKKFREDHPLILDK